MLSPAALDASTLFVVNAASLVVFALVYLVAWCRRSNRKYWLNLAVANIIFALAFVMFSQRVGGGREELLLPNCLVVIGLGFRWQAVRVFFGHQPSYLLSVALTGVVGALFYGADILGAGAVFGGVNVVIALQVAVIIYALALERHDHLPSRWGLIGAYGILLASSALRVVQGWMIDNDMSSLLPADLLLDIHLLVAAIHIVASGAFSLSMAYEQGTERLEKAALHDPLTGLLNRLGLERALDKVMTSTPSRCALLIVDIDNFKTINDLYGHAAGDVVIQGCGQAITEKLRGGDFAARVGGEEFVIVLPDVTLDEARRTAERLRKAIELREVKISEADVRFTVSIGISIAEVGQRSFAELLLEADRQLYRAKSYGRNAVRTPCDA